MSGGEGFMFSCGSLRSITAPFVRLRIGVRCFATPPFRRCFYTQIGRYKIFRFSQSQFI